MHKLVRRVHGHLLPLLKTQPRSPRFFTPAPRLQSPTKTLFPDPKLGFILNEFEEFQSAKPLQHKARLATINEQPAAERPRVHVEHPWPEWVELMQCLTKRGYFQGGENPFQSDELGAKDLNVIRTACLNFARDRFELMRFFARADIRVVAEAGCPSLDRKVVNSGKRLRGYVGIDEGNVCSTCMLRGNCERAYVKAREDEGGRTVDLMRILLPYGLDHIYGSVENKTCQSKRIKESVRRLLKEMIKLSRKEQEGSPIATSSQGLSYLPENSTHEKGPIEGSMKQGDWHCPNCNFMNFARNIRCLRCDGLFQERIRKLGEDQDHLPLKKGDWICHVCNFLNFAKNTRCLQCKEKPNRQLHPGEWECDSCNYINFRKNMVCLKCDHRRLIASKHSDAFAQSRHDEGDFHNPCGISGKTRHNRSRDAWRFVEDEREDYDGSNPNHENLAFMDFPIAGGKSELSQSAEKRERWKAEAAQRRRHSVETIENIGEFRSTESRRSQRRLELLESSDDEEMAEWFGNGKKMEAQKLGHVSEDEEIQD